MADNPNVAAASAEERPVGGASRPRRRPMRAVILILLTVLVVVTAWLLYDGTIYRTAIQILTAENENQRQSIRGYTADNEGRDRDIRTLSEESEEKDAEILTLSEESEEKDAEILTLSGESGEKDAEIRELTVENKEKDQQLRALQTRLSAANVPLEYQAAIREAAPAAALQALELPEGLEQSEETERSLLAPLLQTAYLEADPDNSREDHLAFTVHAANGRLLGRVAFEPAAGGRAGESSWITAEERYDFSGCFKTASLTVPSDYQVYLGDQLLGPACIRQEGIPYAALIYAAEEFDGLPSMVRYETPPFLGEPALRVLNEKGQELPAEDLREEVFFDRCPAGVREQIEAFLPDFLELYLLFSADIGESAYYYYDQLKHMVVMPDSPLYLRMRSAFEGLGYSAARGAKLLSVTVNGVMELGGGRYAVDLNYLSLITGHSSAVPPMEDDLHILLILVQTENGGFLAEALYYL